MKTFWQHVLFAVGIAMLAIGVLGTFSFFIIGLTFSRSLHDILLALMFICITAILAGSGASILHYLLNWRSSF